MKFFDKKPAPLAEHDPLARRKDGEPMFPLLGRDPFASGLARLHSALRAHREARAIAIFANLLETMRRQPPPSKSDMDNALSAQAKANEIDLWRATSIPRPSTSGRLSAIVTDALVEKIEAEKGIMPRIARLFGKRS